MDDERQAQSRQQLRQFLETEIDSLTGVLRLYAYRAGLPADPDSVSELLNAVVVEALDHADRFDPARPPRAWLLGIAANLVRRRQVEQARRSRREPLAGDLAQPGTEKLSEDELFDRLAQSASGALEQEVADRQGLSAALALLSSADRQIIHLFSQGDLDGEAMARSLQLSPGAARVRLHRALTRLRRIWHNHQEEGNHAQI